MATYEESYKGQQIEVDEEKKDEPTLRVGDREVHVEVTEEGTYHSHELMFQEFGSPAELARALIDQYGTAEPGTSDHPDKPHPHH